MKKRLVQLLPVSAACLLAAAWTGCGGGEERPENILARVGDSLITLEDFRREWAAQPPPPPGEPAESVDLFLDDMIAERLFLAEARRRRLDRDEELQREVERYREQLMVERLLGREVLAVPPPSPEEVEAFWSAHREIFTVPELTRLSHILIRPGEGESEESAVERLLAVRERLEEGEEFAAAAREVSEGSSAVRGGDLGFFREEQIIPEFREAAGELEIGEISAPIRTDYGYHLLVVTETRPPREKTFEESREEAAAILLAERRKARFEETRAAIAATVPVEKNRELIGRIRVEPPRAPVQPPGTLPGM